MMPHDWYKQLKAPWWTLLSPTVNKPGGGKLTGGAWRTIRGSPVYIKGGKIVAGNPQVVESAAGDKGWKMPADLKAASKPSGGGWIEPKKEAPAGGWKIGPKKETPKKEAPKKEAPKKESPKPEPKVVTGSASDLPTRKQAESRTENDAAKLEQKLIAKTSLELKEPPPPIAKGDGRAAAGGYTGADYVKINRQLREGKDPKDAEPKPKVEHLQRLAQQELPEPVVVYRGVRGDAAAALQSLKPGDSFEAQGMISTSLNPEVAKSFTSAIEAKAGAKSATRSKGVIMEIKAKRGVAVGSASDHDEYEVVQAHGTKYKVLGTRTGAEGETVLTTPAPPATEPTPGEARRTAQAESR